MTTNVLRSLILEELSAEQKKLAKKIISKIESSELKGKFIEELLMDISNQVDDVDFKVVDLPIALEALESFISSYKILLRLKNKYAKILEKTRK